ncbi:hypothetical protein, partial [Candidatus Symbiopectobacterium sp. NZEC135]|uniref:hypothetical protein n=1 Tax=Candidatus Symbiopectobacterium sp. NZEC135 TaxID=2820471 RepID=UPI002226B863
AGFTKWREASKFNFAEIANLRPPNPPASVPPEGNRAGRGEPQKFCRPSEQKGIPQNAGFCGGLAPHTVAAKSPAQSR